MDAGCVLLCCSTDCQAQLLQLVNVGVRFGLYDNAKRAMGINESSSYR